MGGSAALKPSSMSGARPCSPAGTVSEGRDGSEQGIAAHAGRMRNKSWECAPHGLARMRRQQGRPQEAAALLRPDYAWVPNGPRHPPNTLN